jgi:hypothetical protein
MDIHGHYFASNRYRKIPERTGLNEQSSEWPDEIEVCAPRMCWSLRTGQVSIIQPSAVSHQLPGNQNVLYRTDTSLIRHTVRSTLIHRLTPPIMWYHMHAHLSFSAIYAVMNTGTDPCQLQVATSNLLVAQQDLLSRGSLDFHWGTVVHSFT